MALLEREVPLAALAEYAGQARKGEGLLVLVSGEAGVGKSALLDELAVGLDGESWYWGACDGLFTPRPLGAFLDIAGQLGGALSGIDSARADRDELFRALQEELAQPGRLRVVVIEDVHWADEATLDLLRFLARRISGLPVLIIATYRDDELAVSYPLRVALGDLAMQRCTRRIDLSPLSERAVAKLAIGSGLDAAELYMATGGNPFYVVATLQSGLDQIPRSVQDVVLGRAARVGPQARDVLGAAALIGASVEPWLLEKAAAATPELVDELVGHGLLTSNGTALRFRHEIARRAHVPMRMARVAANVAERHDSLGLSGEPALTRYAVDQMAHDIVLDLSKAATQGWQPRWALRDYLAKLRLLQVSPCGDLPLRRT